MATRHDTRSLIQERLQDERSELTVVPTAPFCLMYPSPYRVGMSSLGFQTLYRLLNERGIGCHRAFLPDDWERQSLPWPQPKQPILAYESLRPVSDYPILGLSVAYELEVTGVIRLLEGAGIPLLAKDRGPRDPIIIGGGPLTNSNPSLLLPFVDLLISGEAELALPLAIEAITAERSRESAIASASALPFTGLGVVSEGLRPELPAAAYAQKDVLPAYSAIVTPHTELSNMFLVEPERGCSRPCTFCVMRGPTTGGMRIVDMQTPLSLIPSYAKKVGLVGAAVTDLPHLEQLVAKIVEGGRGVGISSLRADRLTPTLLTNLRAGGYKTITVASDGISERMRERLDRRITEESLLRAATLVGERDFHKLKVYQMMGAPGETDDDVEDLIRFCLELRKLTRLALTFSTFVAKRNTPLDGEPFVGIKVAEQRLKRIQKGLRGQVEIRPQPPKWAWVEYMLAQRGPEVGLAAVEAVHAGGRFADWKRAFANLPPQHDRRLVYGDEARRANRTGFAVNRPRLPMVP